MAKRIDQRENEGDVFNLQGWCLTVVLKTVYLCRHLLKYTCLLGVPLCMCGGQRIDYRSQFCLFHQAGLKDWTRITMASVFYSTNQLASPTPKVFLSFLFTFNSCLWIFAYMSALCCAWCPQKPKKGIRSPKTMVTNSCELLCEYWESHLVPLGKQPAMLTSEHLSGSWALFNLSCCSFI